MAIDLVADFAVSRALSRPGGDARRLAVLNGAVLVVGLALIALNALVLRYTGALYLPRLAWPLVPLVVVVAAYGGPRWSEASWYAATLIVQAILVTGLQYTPFPPIDGALARWDAALGLNVASLTAWTYAHPPLMRLLWACYFSVGWQLVLVPALACVLQERRRMRTFVYAIIYSFLAGGLFYYFFPSSGPAAVYRHAFFAPVQRLTSYKFYLVHHGRPVTTIAGGLIAFPSFHVAWAVLLTYLACCRRWAFYPVLALNALLIVSTVLLGWHFFVDVAAGAALAAGSLWLGRLSAAS